MASLADRLRDLSEARGLTPYALAKAAGIDPTYIYRILKGQGKRPSHKTLTSLASALRVTVEDLTGAPPMNGAEPEPDLPLIPAGPIYARGKAGAAIPPAVLALLLTVAPRFTPADWARLAGYIERIAEERAPK